MVYTLKMFIEITSLEQLDLNKIYVALQKNFEKSHIEIYKASEFNYIRDSKLEFK